MKNNVRTDMRYFLLQMHLSSLCYQRLYNYGHLMSLETIKPTCVFTQNVQYLCPISIKFGFSGQLFMKVPNIKFHGHPSSGSRGDTRRDGQTERWMGRRVDVTKLIGAFRDSAKSPKNCRISTNHESKKKPPSGPESKWNTNMKCQGQPLHH